MIETNRTIIRRITYLTFSYINLLANILGQNKSNIIITDKKYLRLVILVLTLYIFQAFQPHINLIKIRNC